MKCEIARKMLVDYVNEVLKEKDSRKVQEHTAECEDCRGELYSLQNVLELVDDVQVEYPPAPVWENFLPDLHRRIANEAAVAFKKQRRQRLYLLPAWSAVLAIVLFLSASLIMQDNSIRPIQIQRASNIGIVRGTSTAKSDSESTLVAGLISEVLISEADAEKLRKLQGTIQTETTIFPYYLNYDEEDVLIDKREKTDTITDKDKVIQYLEDEFTEFDRGIMVEPDDSEFGAI